MHHYSTNAGDLRSQAELDAQADLEARIGNGEHFSLADFNGLNLQERVQLHKAAPAVYEKLNAGQELDGKWRPTSPTVSMGQANL